MCVESAHKALLAFVISHWFTHPAPLLQDEVGFILLQETHPELQQRRQWLTLAV